MFFISLYIIYSYTDSLSVYIKPLNNFQINQFTLERKFFKRSGILIVGSGTLSNCHHSVEDQDSGLLTQSHFLDGVAGVQLEVFPATRG